MLDTELSITRHARIAGLAIGLLGGTALLWGGLYPLDGAVFTLGTVTVEGNVKKVQHPTGGVVGEVAVHEGSRVKVGDVVARLDDTQTRTALGVILGDLTAFKARVVRLAAERDDAPELRFPAEITLIAEKDAITSQAVQSELRLFAARRRAREGMKAQLLERISQTEKELQSTQVQLRATMEQLAIASEERQALEPLRLKGLVQKPRLTSLDREISRSEGTIGDAKARIELSHAKIRETQVQIEQVDRDRIAETNKDMREAEAKIVELNERKTAAEDMLRRVDIKSPADGVVHELIIHTVGGVVNAGEPMMLIVPYPQVLVIETRVAPQDIDQVHLEQQARVRFTSFNQRLTPEMIGAVFRISPNTTRDQQTGATYYTVGVRLADDQKDKLNGALLVPGMMAETFITTASRTALSFLFKPITDNIIKVFSGR